MLVKATNDDHLSNILILYIRGTYGLYLDKINNNIKMFEFIIIMNKILVEL